MQVRYTTEDDWPQLKAVRLAALLDAPTAFGVTHASAAAYTEAQWRHRASGQGAARFLLAFMGGVAVGMAGHHVGAESEMHLIGMWVRPEWRGTQMAAQLVEAVQAGTIAQGHTRIVLDVSPENGRAAAFYRRLGFTFLPEWEALESHPEITLQKMEWRATARVD